MRKIYLLLLMSISLFAEAQSISSSVVAAGGNFLTNSSGSLSLTLGQSLAGSITKNSVALHQGFQVNLNSGTTVTAVLDEIVSLEVFPNPTTQHLFIKGGNELSAYSFEMIDITGKPLHVEQIKTEHVVELNLHDLTPALYVLRIQHLNGRIQTISVIKSN